MVLVLVPELVPVLVPELVLVLVPELVPLVTLSVPQPVPPLQGHPQVLLLLVLPPVLAPAQKRSPSHPQHHHQ